MVAQLAAQILSTLSWAQVAMASNYTRMAVMHAMHKSVRRLCSASPWKAENTMHTVYTIALHQLCAQNVMVTKLMHWLFRHAKRHNTDYTDTIIPTELQPEGYEPSSCTGIHLLQACSTASYLPLCVCVCAVRW